MTHDELLAEIDEGSRVCEIDSPAWSALRAVVELHKPRTDEAACIHCSKTGFWISYPCPTIQAIEKELE
jgi:hypothetical protein